MEKTMASRSKLEQENRTMKRCLANQITRYTRFVYKNMSANKKPLEIEVTKGNLVVIKYGNTVWNVKYNVDRDQFFVSDENNSKTEESFHTIHEVIAHIL